MPPGQAWDGGTIRDILTGLSMELARIEEAYLSLVDEADPRTADQTIDRWEAITGLVNPGYTLAQRQSAVAAQIVARGGTTKAYLKGLAYVIGYVIEITELHPALAGAAVAGDAAYGEEAPFAFIVSILSGDMTTNGQQTLIKAIERAKPAHTAAVYDFIDTRARVGIMRAGDRLLGGVL